MDFQQPGQQPINQQPEEIKKSYDPFKMLGSWTGFVLGIVSVASAYITNHVLFLHPIVWAYSLGLLGANVDSEGLGILAALTLPIVFFIYGWGIHLILRKINRENSIVVIILVAMIVVLPTMYGLVKDQQTFKATVNSADSDIRAAKALPEGTQRTGEDFRRESVAMNAIMAIAKAEPDTSVFVSKMLSIAHDESVAIDVRLTALEALMPRIDVMNSNEKLELSRQLELFTGQLTGVNNERMDARISALQKKLETSK
jgi:hypothetical protein